VAELNRTAAILLRGEVAAAGGEALIAGDIGPTGSILAPTGTLDYEEAVDIFAEQAAGLVAGGVDLLWIETMSDLAEIKAAIEGVRRVAPGHAAHRDNDVRHRGHTMMGVSPEQAVASLDAWGADAVGGNCGNGPDELLAVIRRMHAAAPDVRLVAKSNAGCRAVDMRAVYRTDPATMAPAPPRCARPAPRSSVAAAAPRPTTWRRWPAMVHADLPIGAPGSAALTRRPDPAGLTRPVFGSGRARSSQ
jgi:5-methyltetrahydrofolate--homocysteine methyltransferase